MKVKRGLIFLVTLFMVTSFGVFMNKVPGYGASGMEASIGSIALFSYTPGRVPMGWIPCDGRTLNVYQNQALYALIGNNFGGNGSTTFQVPNLTNASPLPGTTYMMCTEGIWGATESAYVIGEICLLPDRVATMANNMTEDFWVPCRGQALSTSMYQSLYAQIGNTYGGDGSTFRVPDLSETSPLAGLNFYIATQGTFVTTDSSSGTDPLMGSISMFSNRVIPRDFIDSDQRTLYVQQNQALFSLLGARFGGNGTTTFAVPDLRGASPLPGVRYAVCQMGIYPSFD